MILQHMDLDTIGSRIGSGSILSTKELFRDLLLLANNALVFYSKTTREYKSALLLRDIVTKSLRHHLKNYISRSTINFLLTTPSMINPPVRTRNARPGDRKFPGKVAKSGNPVIKNPNADKRPTDAHSCPSMKSLAMTKKGSGRPRKTGRGSATEQPEILTKGRKKMGTK
uniref:Bromo domain-containing protein n=1 Tax=Rhizophora mucronata TaxID=61149 RepID=A0A2P2J981_RHIMU